tara:strand:+ start:612 stop:776 length:165 start_codon:yes stop_codon:yes gene_type:complete
MASGDLVCSTPTFAISESEIDTQITALNLAATTDNLFCVPHNNGFLIFKAERTA